MSRTDSITAPSTGLSLRRLVRAVLTHPAAVRLKAPLRNVWWALKGLGTKNPPVPRHAASMLFVCLGNICRSPFGAERAKQLLDEAGRGGIRCSSAGIRPSQDNRSPDEACRAALAYGVALTGHRPQLLTRELMESHDMVVVMEWRHLSALRGAYPEHQQRLFLLPLFDDRPRNAYERYNITDPFGSPADVFEECYRRMDRSLVAFLAAVQP